MMNLSFSELLIIFGIALIVFGPDRLPEIGKGLGRAVRSFKAASAELQGELGTSLNFDLGEADETAEKSGAAVEPASLPPPPPPVFKADPK